MRVTALGLLATATLTLAACGKKTEAPATDSTVTTTTTAPATAGTEPAAPSVVAAPDTATSGGMNNPETRAPNATATPKN